MIREINGRKLSDSLELSSVVAELTPGKSVSLKYLRDGKEQTASLTIDDRSKIFTKNEDGDPTEESEPERGGTKLGMTVQGLTAQQARDFDMQPGEGVLVTNVQVGGVADDAGLRARDVILQINKMPVRNAEELRDIVSKLKPESEVLFLIKRLDRAVWRCWHSVPGSNSSRNCCMLRRAPCAVTRSGLPRGARLLSKLCSA